MGSRRCYLGPASEPRTHWGRVSDAMEARGLGPNEDIGGSS